MNLSEEYPEFFGDAPIYHSTYENKSDKMSMLVTIMCTEIVDAIQGDMRVDVDIQSSTQSL